MIHPASSLRTAVFLFAAVFTLASCAAGSGAGSGFPGDDRTALIASSDAVFHVRFPAAYSGGEDVCCSGDRSGDTVTLTVERPERIAGVVFSLTMGANESGSGARPFSAAVSGPEFPAAMPVDPAAARALTGVFSILYDPDGQRARGAVPDPESGGIASEEAVFLFVPAVERIGEETAFRYETGTLILSPDGLPARVECPDLAGRLRTVVFEDYAVPAP